MQTLTAKIYRSGRAQYMGTAWLCSRNYALTASHCVGDRKLKEVYSGPFRLEFPKGTLGDAPMTVEVEQVKANFDLDAALLTIPPDKIPPDIEFAPCGALPDLDPWPQPPSALGWSSYGFPSGYPEGLTLNGLVDSPNATVDGFPAIQITCAQGGYDALDGASGAAIRQGSMVVGLVRSQPNAYKGKVIFGPPLQKIAEAFPAIKELLNECGPAQGLRNRVCEMISAVSEEDVKGLVSGYGVGLEEMAAKPHLRRTLAAILTCRAEDLGNYKIERLQEAVQECIVRGTRAETSVRQRGTPGRAPHNLPARPKLVDREEDLDKAKERLLREDVRLLNLIGPPGAGKTRLGLGVATQVLPQFTDGVFFLDLTPTHDASQVLLSTSRFRELLVAEIARTLEGIAPHFKTHRDQAGLCNFLQDKLMLLVLDNFEHVLPGAGLIPELLENCPSLKILVTSQLRLSLKSEKALEWERLFVVSPFRPPSVGERVSSEELKQNPAVALFIARARLVQDDFELTDRNAGAVAEICNYLDGLPLAIELAAAQTDSLDAPREILNRLKGELGDQILERVFSSTYARLEPKEQTLFRLLSVFVGGSTVKTAQTVCAEVEEANFTVESGINELSRKNLLRKEKGPDGESRYVMLSTVRFYGVKQLKRSPEAASGYERYANFYLALAEEAELKLTSEERAPGKWIERLDTETDNLRGVLEWSEGPEGDREIGLRLAGALFWFYNFRGYFSQGITRLRTALAGRPATERTAPRAKALYGLGGLAFLQSDFKLAISSLDESISLWRELGDERSLGYALIIRGMVALEGETGENHLKAALELLQESKRLLEKSNDKWGYALALNDLGRVVTRVSGYESACPLFEESLNLWKATGDDWGRPLTLNTWGLAAYEAGKYEMAHNRLREALTIQRKLDDKWGVAASLRDLGLVLEAEKQYSEAAKAFKESLQLHRELGRKELVARCLEGLESLALVLKDPERAQHFSNAAKSLRKQIGSPDSAVPIAGDGAIEQAIDEALTWAATVAG